MDDKQAAEGQIPRTVACDDSLDETFDVGCDKGSPVTHEYEPKAILTGRIVKIDFDLKPDLHLDPQTHAEMHAKMAMVSQ